MKNEMIKQLVTKSIFVIVVLLITRLNNYEFIMNLTSLAIIMLIIHLFIIISQLGAYDTIYYRFGSFYNSRKNKEDETDGDKNKYKSFESYKKSLNEHREGIKWHNVAFYVFVILITFIV